MGRLRLFVGVRVAVGDALREVMEALGEVGRPVRVTAAENVHVTLRFLGSRDEAEVEPIVAAMREAAAGVEAFDAALVGLGAFPGKKRPRVVWVGLREEGRLARLAESLHRWLDAAGLAPKEEDRPWTAHVTVARVGASRRRRSVEVPTALTRVLETYEQRRFGSIRVDRLSLMASELRATGPVYRVVEEVALG